MPSLQHQRYKAETQTTRSGYLSVLICYYYYQKGDKKDIQGLKNHSGADTNSEKVGEEADKKQTTYLRR